MTTTELAARPGGPAECGGVEVESVDPDWGRERHPLDRYAAWLCRDAGADPEVIPAWVEEGLHRRTDAPVAAVLGRS